MSWFKHTLYYKIGNGSAVALPEPVSVAPVYELSESEFRTAAGVRRRNRKGVWVGCKIHWQVTENDITTISTMLSAESSESDNSSFYLSLDNTQHFYRAHLAKDPDIKPLEKKNAGLDITLEFIFVTRQSSYPSLHLGQ